MPSHATCVPINTYGGNEDKQIANDEQDTYKLFPVATDPDTSVISSKVNKRQLPLVTESSGELEIDVNYSQASVDFTKVYTIPHYIPANKIGRIHPLGLPLLDKCLRQAPDISEVGSLTTRAFTRPPSQSNKMLLRRLKEL